MSDLQYLQEQLAYAEEQFLIADDMYTKITWDNRITQIEGAIADLSAQFTLKSHSITLTFVNFTQ